MEEKRYTDCHECGAHEELHWFKDIEERLLRDKLCFSCAHWTDLLKIKDRPDVVRVKDVHYMVGGETNEPTLWRGFGGDKFHIRFLDGREVKSTNVWCQGHIPDHFKTRLPDNAEFVYAFKTNNGDAHAPV